MTHHQHNFRGSILMMATMAAFTLNDACMKALSVSLPLFQTLFLRALISLILLIIFARFQNALRFDLPRKDWGLIALRTFGEIGAAYFFLTALFNMPLANATAILQTIPLMVTMFAAIVFGETIGWKRMAAILVGFCGVMLIIRPGADGFNIYSVYALISVGFVTLRDLATRRLSTKTPSLMVAIFAAIGVTVFSGIGSLNTQWVQLDLTIILLICSASLFIFAGYVLSVMVMRIGEISFVAPFRYTSLLWALLLGFFLFREWPDTITLLGGAIIVATGVFSFYRERKLHKVNSKTPPDHD